MQILSIDGILCIDKPANQSSHYAITGARKIVTKTFNQATKVGHGGTLDPFATGHLPIFINKATRYTDYALHANKRYQASIKLGQQTNTGDLTGDVLATQSIPSLNLAFIEQTLLKFMGLQQQIPPMFSAIKQQGKALYTLAREGIEVERPVRTIEIHQLNLLKFDKDSIDIDVYCSKGTYIRVLAEDIAKQLGTLGHLQALRRTAVDAFTKDIATLEVLRSCSAEQLIKHIAPIDSILMHFNALTLNHADMVPIHHGATVCIDEANYPKQIEAILAKLAGAEQIIRLYHPDFGFLGLARFMINAKQKIYLKAIKLLRHVEDLYL